MSLDKNNANVVEVRLCVGSQFQSDGAAIENEATVVMEPEMYGLRAGSDHH